MMEGVDPLDVLILVPLFFSFDGCSWSGEDGGVQLPAGAGGDGAAGEPAWNVPPVLCSQAGALAGTI